MLVVGKHNIDGIYNDPCSVHLVCKIVIHTCAHVSVFKGSVDEDRCFSLHPDGNRLQVRGGGLSLPGVTQAPLTDQG